jgi:transglutaminase-like putative cysteine protease
MVRDSANQIMLYPPVDQYQEVVHHTIKITSDPSVSIHTDYFGNRVGTFTHAQPHKELSIDSQLVVITQKRPIPDDSINSEEQWSQLVNLKHQVEFIDFLKQEQFPSFEEVKHVAEKERCNPCTPFVSTKHICEYVYKNFAYQKGITTVETTIEEVWKLKSGVCQDFAHMLLVMLRLMGIPARYVSGYICPNKSGMRGEGATHAWVEAYMPSFGWLGLDPTNNCIVNDTHVRLAVGKNFSDCSPVRGTYRGTSDHTMEVSVAVSYEDGHTVAEENVVVEPATPLTSIYKNSFQRYQEMQMQQQ